MAGTLVNRLRHIYLKFVGGQPDETTEKQTEDITARLQGINFEEPSEETEEGERLAKTADSRDDALADAVYGIRGNNPLNN